MVSGISTKLEVIKPEYLYSIGNIIAQATEWKPALDEISQLVHSIIIFDNLAVYLSDSKNNSVDVMYARAMGRGRKAEADVSWGETLANQIIACNQTILREPSLDPKQDRLQQAYMLGIPLTAQRICLGAIIFIRFGGPSFDTESQQLAEFIAGQITLLIQCQNLQLEYQKLEAQQAQSQLQEDFISTITHELRNPLGFIKGYTTTLLRSDTTWDQTTQQEFLEIIDHETDRLEELIENLLDSARLQSGQLKMQFRPVSTDSLINTVITRTRLHYPDLTITIETDKNVPPVMGDAGRLAQVLENLISNAVKYAPGSDIAIIVRKEKEYACISVKDRGPGIPEQYISHLFERFYRIPNQEPNVHGSGLGLYICKQIVEIHRGFISANSIEGKGTSFDIRLPFKS
jgi:signal transduction histidine kinase